MDVPSLSFSSSLQQLILLLRDYWLIPVGLSALYFYGTFHFNTPDYDVAGSIGGGPAAMRNLQTFSLAPPRFTTTRRRYRFHALTYVLLLQIAFIVIVFAWSAAAQIAETQGMKFPNEGDLQTRAVWALFALTGLLSSFPGFKDLDTWILKFLHARAMIPGAARVFAERLFDADFVPSPEIRGEVRRMLIMRDTMRVSDGSATGSLEIAILRTLWLKQALEDRLSLNNCMPFQIRMDRELGDIRRTTDNLIIELRRYLAEQVRSVDISVTDIDEFFESPAGQALPDLKQRRSELLAACESVRYRLCVLTSLLVNVTTNTPEAASKTVQEIGFHHTIPVVPDTNWEALVKISLTVFVVILVFNAVVIGAYELFGVIPHDAKQPGPGRRAPFLFSLIITILYGFIIAATRSLKKFWARNPDAGRNVPQNVITSLCGYAIGVVAVFCLATLFGRGGPSSHAWVAIAQLQLAVAGWFAGIYVDREIKGKEVSNGLAALQAFLQFVASLIGALYLAEPPIFHTTLFQQCAMYGFIACQSALGGLVIGYMVQRFYVSGSSPDNTTLGGPPSGIPNARAGAAAIVPDQTDTVATKPDAVPVKDQPSKVSA